MAAPKGSRSRRDWDKVDFLLEGIVDAIIDQDETETTFKEWEGLIAREAQAARRARRRRGWTDLNFIEASRERWEPQILAAAKAFIGQYRFLPQGPASTSLLTWRLVGRFLERIAERERWPSRTVYLLTDLSDRPIGQDFSFKIPASWPISRVRAALRPSKGSAAPAGSLPDFLARVDATIRTVEKHVKAKPGRPVADYKDALRRDGRWLFVVETGRTKVEELAESYHHEQGPDHSEEQGIGICDHCVRTIHRRLQGARKLLRLADNTH